MPLPLPLPPPLPPVPVPPPVLLSPAERKEFTTRVNSLKPAGFAGAGTDPSKPENAYQLRVAGYPERLVPLPKAFEKETISADGMRADDGMMIDAKYVKKPNCEDKSVWRKPSTFEEEDEYKADGTKKWNRKDVLVGRDKSELEKYRQAMLEHKQFRGLEIITNDKSATAYWQTLMALQGVKGNSRYEP
ncbi:restriction endonuclease fold toxin-2 domain-containing protein [Streptomyces sp. NPDC050610]|uniref:restriction endonuclease fold toxin-2 domain-containing protein n=1 Tax=Streptomyces sp. NPDC050610 TaxID=3157097 RepID=UPI003430CFE8